MNKLKSFGQERNHHCGGYHAVLEYVPKPWN